MDAQPGTTATDVRPGGVKAFVLTGRITLALIAVQFGLAGLGAFEGLDGGDVKDTYWSPHATVGYAVALLLIVLTVLAFVGRVGSAATRLTVIAAALAVIGQPLLAGLGTGVGGWFGALHALDGVAIAALLGIATSRVAAPPAPAQA